MSEDLTPKMDIAALVGAERLREIMTELVDRCASVERYGVEISVIAMAR